MNLILNILWVFFGGFLTAFVWMFASLIMLVTIVGIPWARATFNIGLLCLWPFGAREVARKAMSGSDLGTGLLGTLGNIIWFLLAGWWLFIYHISLMIGFAVTIIGIPFAVQYWKMAKMSLSPIGSSIVWPYK